MEWMCMELPAPSEWRAAQLRLGEFLNIWGENNCPADAALFVRESPSGGRDFFFSPGAVAIAKAWMEQNGAVACPCPPRQGMDVLVGLPEAIRLLS